MRERDRNRRAARWGVEQVESRELLSGLLNVLSGSRPSSSQVLVALLSKQTGVSAAALDTTGSSSPLIGQGTPAPHELAREAFKAYFQGMFYTSPGRFSDQAATIYIRGIGGSNQFLHGDFNMAVVTPTDPKAPLTGVAVLEDKSTNSSGIVGLDLTADRNTLDSRGRPTRLTFTSDPNIYSGIYFVSTSNGTVDIKYEDKGHKAVVRFNGLLYTTGLTSPLVNTDLYARHNRPLRNRVH